jgi:hypothetical protein
MPSGATANVPAWINSFDVFDTLIARRRVESRRVLQALEARVQVPGLARARLEADRQVGNVAKPYTLNDIWMEVCRALNLRAAEAARLLQLEVQIEHEQVIPIVENLELVCDGDVLVSDTYLPAAVVMSLLRTAGLRRHVALVVSNDGKFRGTIWPRLLERLAIREHFGDNPHSDGRTPSSVGIKAIIFTGAARSPTERLLADRGFEALANIAREARLANPFSASRPKERHLWLLACQLNFPFLYFASLLLERHAQALGASELLFVSRDCLLWRDLHHRLFPRRRSTYLYGSRMCLLRPSSDYLDYFRSTWHTGSVVVDLFSTGASWSRMFSRLGARAACFFISFVDDYAYLPDAPRPEESLDLTAVFRNSEFGFPITKGVEILNYAPHASVENVISLPHGAVLPVLAETLEYNPDLPTAAHQAFSACIRAMDHHPDLPREGADSVRDLIREFVRLICADSQLPQIYAGHAAADAAYLKRLLG